MIGFLVGILISIVAAIPSFLLNRGGSGGDIKTRWKLWGVGVLIRFTVIGTALYFLFTQSEFARVPTVIGVAVAYFILFMIENTVLRRT